MIEFSEDAEKEPSENKKGFDGKGNDNQDILNYSRDEKISGYNCLFMDVYNMRLCICTGNNYAYRLGSFAGNCAC